MSEPSDASPLEPARAKQREVLQDVSAQAESESARLLGLLRRTADLTRQLSVTEAQIGRQEELKSGLEGDLAGLTRRKADVEKETKVLAMERDSARADLSAAEQSKAKLETEVQEQLKTIKRLVKDNDDLQREVDKLELRRARLDESVENLRRAKDEYLAKIESLKTRQDALAPK